MCREETGEEHCSLSDATYDEAHNWINENADAFIESKFWVEEIEDYTDEDPDDYNELLGNYND
jgi:hypothetical protein